MDAISFYIVRIIGAKDYLCKVKISNDHICSFCKDYNKTIMCLFGQCEKARTF